MTGAQIGLFGQSDHWKLDTIGQTTFRGTPTRKMSNSVIAHSVEQNTEKETEEKATASFITDLKPQQADDTVSNDFEIPPEMTEFVYKREYTGLLPQLTFQFEQDAFIKDTSLRYNPWSKTILGKSYQECRIKKRDRRQPGIIQSEEFQIWDKTGQAPGGLYGVIRKKIKFSNKKNQINTIIYSI
jgi:hypothetical protein